MIALDLLHQAVVLVAQQLTRACLKLDPGTRYRLKGLDGKLIAVRSRKPEFTVFISSINETIELSVDATVPADVFVFGEIPELIKFFRGNEDVEEKLSIDGDKEVLKQLIEIINDLDVDWESAIAPITGDVIAHSIGQNIRSAEKWFTQSFVEVKRLADEYMEEELPVAAEKFNNIKAQMQQDIEDVLGDKVPGARKRQGD